MQALRFLLSPSGRLKPQTFIVAIIAVYTAGLASHLLTLPAILAHGGPWPFAASQALLIWIWFALHARRLNDAGSSVGLAAGAAVLYALAVVLLLVLATAFFTIAANSGDTATGALGLILFVMVIDILIHAPSLDIGWFIVLALAVVACLPFIVAAAVTLWAATRPSRDGAT
jgi:hypothetical protein